MSGRRHLPGWKLRLRLRLYSRRVKVPPDGGPLTPAEMHAFIGVLQVFPYRAGADAIAAEDRAVEAARARGAR